MIAPVRGNTAIMPHKRRLKKIAVMVPINTSDMKILKNDDRITMTTMSRITTIIPVTSTLPSENELF